MLNTIAVLDQFAYTSVVGLMIAVVAFVYCVILTRPNMILADWARWLYKMIQCRGSFCNPARKEEHWLYKILISCQWCVAGQLALWLYLVQIIINHERYNLIEHLYIVSWSILMVELISTLYNRWLRN